MDLEKLIIKEDETILKAMEKLDQAAKKILFIVENEKLTGVLTDGDIRRWILAKGSIEAKVREAANYKPKSVKLCEQENVKAVMKKYGLEAVPIVDDENRIIKVVFWNDQDLRNNKNSLDIPVVMMAGGMGTRLYPYTKILPKPLIPVGDIPIAELIMDRFYDFGCKDFYLIVNHKKNMIKAYFNELEKNYKVSYADEEQPLGTGGGLGLLKGRIRNTFILTNCDILINEDFQKIYKYHKERGNIITMVCSLKNFEIPYGVVEIGEEGSIEAMKEKPRLSFFTNTGCYLVEPEVIEQMEQNKVQGFPDVIEKYKNQGKKVGVYPVSEQSWLDMGQLDELEKMRERVERR